MEERSGNDNNDSGHRTVVIHRGEHGYGLTVSGEGPVIVQDVKEWGPAAEAGVRKWDSIIKVNGKLVSSTNHKEVVQIIQSAQSVTLTLRSRMPDDPVCSYTISSDSSKLCGSKNERITGPVPVDTPLQSQYDANKVKMLHTYLAERRKVREALIAQLSRNSSESLQITLEKKLRKVDQQITDIQSQLKNLSEVESQLPQSFPRSPPLSRLSFSRGPQPYYIRRHHSHSSSDIPPPLPAKCRSLVSQSSFNYSSGPPLPPRPLERLGGEGSFAHSLENIPKMPNLSHSVSSVSDSGVRLSHTRAKSSPDPLNFNNSSGKMSTSISLIEMSSKSKALSAVEEITAEVPSESPPPPYSSRSPSITQEDEEETYSSVPDELEQEVTKEVMPPSYPSKVQTGIALSLWTNNPNFFSKPSTFVASPNSSQLTSPSGCNDQGGLLNNFGAEYMGQNILSMEDDEFSDSEQKEDHGPFQSLSRLWKTNAHLSVFMNYLISNCDSSSLPLRLCNIDEAVLVEIDDTLRLHLDKEEILRKIFWKVRQRAREELKEQLADFCQKRSAGLGSIFGPPDHQLEEALVNKTKELSIVEQILVPCLETISEDVKIVNDDWFIMASSLATVLWKYFGVKSQNFLQLIDRFPLFVNKDRHLMNKLFKASKKQTYLGHHFNPHTYYSVSYCTHCGLILWGVAPQGYQCTNCGMNTHKQCVKVLDESCIGQLHKKDKSKDKLSLLNKLKPEEKENKRKLSQGSSNNVERLRREYQDDVLLGDKGSGNTVAPALISSAGSAKEQRRSDPGSTGGQAVLASSCYSNSIDDDGETNNGEGGIGDVSTSPDFTAIANSSSIDGGPTVALKSQSGGKKKSSGSINRSESCKEKQNLRKRTRENRKHSDPNIPSSKSGDVDGDSGLNYTNSGSSSNSSLLLQPDSPSTSLEQFQELQNDSDIEAEAHLPDWQQHVPSEIQEKLQPRERKKQDTINELFHTERTHVRLLKLLQSLFYVPMLKHSLVSQELLDLLFPNIDQTLEFHKTFNQTMKKRRSEGPIVSYIGDILLNMFDGEQGRQFQEAAATFVKNQSMALEALKQCQKRDERLNNFLQDQENLHYCRRLQLKDMLPAGFQRLSKYPLLLELLQGQVDPVQDPEEYASIAKALERSKEILAYVNTAVQDAENHQRLVDIQKRLDQSSLAKSKSAPNSEELKGNLDLTKHKLLYEGPLLWRVSKGQKAIDLHVLILEEFIVLLQKDGDRYILRNHSVNNKSVGDSKLTHSPIIKYDKLLIRPVAIDNSAMYLLITQQVGPKIYELVTSSQAERQMWVKYIEDAQGAYISRDGRNRRPEHSLPFTEDSQQSAPDGLRNGEDIVEGDGTDAGESATESRGKCTESSGDATANTGATKTPPDTLAKKLESGSGGSGTSSGPRAGRRLQEVQIIQIVQGPTLIQPSEVKVSQGIVLSAEPVLAPIEHLRRKDLKIRQALEDKQHLIADILNIPYEHLESVVDMAGEPSLGNKEPKEIALAAIYQAKCLQVILNDALNIREGDVIAARASQDPASKISTLPLYQTPMTKLLNISGILTQQLNLLLNLVSERDEERERMRKELIASRERLHSLHMRQAPSGTICLGQQAVGASGTDTTLTSSSSPLSSRQNSYISLTSNPDPSDVVDHPLTDEENASETQKELSSSAEGDSGTESVIKEEPLCNKERDSAAVETNEEGSDGATATLETTT